MKDTQVAGRYARALLEALQEGKSVPLEKAVRELTQILQSLGGKEEVWQTLQDPFVPAERKKSLVRACAGNSSPLLLNFVELLVQRKRIREFPLILSYFEKFIDESNGVVRVQVESASELDPQAVRSLEEKLSGFFKKKAVAKVTVNSDLLAGIVARTGDVVLDTSLRTQLDDLKKKIVSI
jgi:F-type H+-transporting ATPase subunit delta